MWNMKLSRLTRREVQMFSQVHSKTYLTLSVLLVGIVWTSASAETIYVDDWAPGSNNGSTWSNAYSSLETALSNAQSGDVIYVAQGFYTPYDPNDPSSQRRSTFQLKNGVTLKGGYAGYIEPDPMVRDWGAYRSTLTGEIGSANTRSDNNYHVVTGSGCDRTAVLDGFTIVNGNANGSDPYDCGGGVYNRSGSPTIRNCTIKYNHAKTGGGGMANQFESHPMVSNCVFFRNEADDFSGGGMDNFYNSSPTVINCNFSQNMAFSGGGGMVNSSYSNPKLINCVFALNSVEWEHSTGGGISNSMSNPSLFNCLLRGNRAGKYGGGMDNAYCSPLITNCTFKDNTAANEGGGIHTWDNSHPVVNNSIFWGNSDAGGTDQSAQIHTASDSHIDVDYSCVQRRRNSLGGAGNISTSPGFADIEGRLSFGSACIDAGDNSAVPSDITTDLDRNPRIVDGIVDMGAYEFYRAGEIIYVDTDAPGSENGSSWANAYTALLSALNVAISGDEIHVAQGVYTPFRLSRQREATFQLVNGVTVKGGYAGYGESNPDARNIPAYQTILSGDVLVAGNNSDNCYHVVTADECPDSTILDGLTITGGNADGQINGSDFYLYGGGMVIKGGSPKVIDCTFTDNNAYKGGDGLFTSNSTAEVKDCIFHENQGQGIYNDDSDLIVTGCAFSGNVYEAMRNMNSHCKVNDCIFSQNASGMRNHTSSPEVTNCMFSRHTGNGGMVNIYSSSPKIINCIFSDNIPGRGMSNMDHSSPRVINCTFRDNQYEGGGGGMFNHDNSNPTIISCAFLNNSAITHVGVEIISPGDGGGIHNVRSNPLVYNCTFKGNTAEEDGGGIFNYESNPRLVNCILWDNRDAGGTNESAQIHNEQNSRPTINHSCVQSWSGTLGGNANFRSNPQLADADGRLSSGSPCIDAGDNNVVPSDITTDLDGNPRIINYIVDLGAYEFGGSTTGAPPAPTGITATEGPNMGEMILTWNPSPRATGYRIFYDEDTSNPPFTPTQNGNPASGSDVGNVTQVTISGLSPGDSYCFAVRAYNAVGESDYSEQQCGRAGPKGQGVDLYDLGESHRSFEPRTLRAGRSGQSLKIYSAIRNGGTESSSACKVSFYVSTDTHITTSDYMIGSKETLDPLAPGGTFSFVAIEAFPTSIPAGDYYVGWIIDVDNDIDETNEQNNTAYKQGYQLSVTSGNTGCCDPPFSPGDRVHLLVNNPHGAEGLIAGMSGTVICCDYDDPEFPVFVSWDGWTNGRNNDGYCDTSIHPYPANSGWWMGCNQIAPGGSGGGTGCCDSSYSPGNRVKLLVSYPRGAAGLSAGKLGTVICCDYDDPELPVFVSWDAWTNGRNSDGYCDTSIYPYPSNSGWWMACDEIEPEPVLRGQANE